MHGAKLSREAVIEGILHWKMHLLVFAITFFIFPAIGLLAKPILLPLLGQQLYWGFIYVFLAIYCSVFYCIYFSCKRECSGAVCSASFSNLVGMFITPVLVSFFILGQSQHGFDPTSSIIQITLLLLVPFVLGQLLRPYVFPYMAKVPSIVKAFDQGSILMVVYGAFSGAVVAGLWHQVSWKTLLLLTIACSVLLTIIMLLALYLPRAFGFNRADQITVFFCGSKDLGQWCTYGTNLIYWPTFRYDRFTNYDLSPNTVNGLWGNCKLLG